MTTRTPDLASRHPFRIRLGFVALLDSAPLILARELGLFAAQGLEVVLNREVSWASLRDKVGAGLLDGAQMLAPMPIAASLGLGAPAVPVTTSLVLSRNGNAITVSSRLYQRLVEAGAQPQDPLRCAQALARVAAAGPLRFASVYPWSCHYLQLRDWIAAAGLQPGRDIELTAIPPSKMVEAFVSDSIDGCCVGEPWNGLAELEGLGRILVTGHQIWQNAPEKVLGMRDDWVTQHPEVHQRLLVALLEACRWLDDPANLAQCKRILALPPYLDRAAQRLAEGSSPFFHPRIQQHFFRNCATFPWLSQASWLVSRMRQWGQLGDRAVPLEQIYRPDIYRLAARRIGLDAPALDGKTEGLHRLPFTVAGLEGPLSVAGDGLLGADSFAWP